MDKQVTILKGSPRINGNTNTLTNFFEECLVEKGATVRSFFLHQMKLKPCTACRECQKDWSIVNCVQDDDFKEIALSICDSDLIVFATPIYS